jgi:hypothetical protein
MTSVYHATADISEPPLRGQFLRFNRRFKDGNEHRYPLPLSGSSSSPRCRRCRTESAEELTVAT